MNIARPGIAAACILFFSVGLAVGAEAPVALRIEPITVPPSTTPLIFAVVKNIGKAPYRGEVSILGPEKWLITPPKRDVELKPGETKRVPFTIEKSRQSPDNRYPLEVTATGDGGATTVCRQSVPCATAPYFKPTIDGDLADWKDAVLVPFMAGGKKATIGTYWNRRQLLISVSVEEDSLIGYQPDGAKEFDAVQVAISPQDTVTGTSPKDKSTRFEFLFVPVGDKTEGKCFQLAKPGMALAEGTKPRLLEPLAYDDAQVAVRRDGNITHYECCIPFSLMRSEIRPSEGREFFLSILIHDPDGTGIRDWGQASGLWPCQRNPLAWSCWKGARWPEKPPFDNKVQSGLCTSKY